MPHKVLDFAHSVATRLVGPGDSVVDATAGNGHDTDLLAGLVGDAGRVWAFDVQAAALRRTAERLARSGRARHVLLIRESHHRMDRYVQPGIRCAMFNLGYLPRADHALVTTAGTTIPALEAAAALLAPGGRLIVVLYRGHEGGREEARAVTGWAAGLDPEAWSGVRYGFSERPGAPPEALIVGRLI